MSPSSCCLVARNPGSRVKCQAAKRANETLELYQVKYFLALCETLSFTRAAERCNVSQPSLTRAIQNLEAELGGPIFHRERQNTHLTELGRIMEPYLRQVYDQAEAASLRAKTFALLKDVELSLGLMCTLGPNSFIDLMAGFRGGHTGVSLYLRDAKAQVLCTMLEAGELDVAILALPEVDGQFHALPLFSERFVIAVPEGHQLEERAAIRLKDLHRQQYLRRINCEFGEYFHEVVLPQAEVEPVCICHSEREDWIQGMVLAGFGWAIIPDSAVEVPGLVTRPLVEPRLDRTVTLITVRGRPFSPAVGAFVRDVKRHLRDASSRSL